jgi:dolichol-phosphate mannosyltransferase
MSLELSIVMPAYKEAEALRKLLPSLKCCAAELTDAYEILVIDAQQPVDETQAVCQAHGVRHIHRNYGNQYGDAVRTGIEAAGGRFIIFMDADGSHNPADLRLLWGQRERYDVVIGSRYVAGGHTENPAILIFMSWVVNVIFRLAFQLHCKDVSNSFRLYHAKLLKPLHLHCHNFDIVEELLILLSGCRIGEVAVTFERRKAGQSKRKLLLFALGYAWTLMRLLKIKLGSRR